MSETATIRVPRRTRDTLAELAEQRGVSVARLVDDMARAAWREAVFAAEREASRRDALNSDVAEEDADWDTTTGDGID